MGTGLDKTQPRGASWMRMAPVSPRGCSRREGCPGTEGRGTWAPWACRGARTEVSLGTSTHLVPTGSWGNKDWVDSVLLGKEAGVVSVGPKSITQRPGS